MVLKSTKQKMLNSAFAIVASLMLIACNKPFSKYVKTGETDIECAGYVGKVRQVDIYENGILIKTTKYNKYGYSTEEMEYPGMSNETVTLFRYNEFGKMSECKYTSGTYHTTEHNRFDEHGNLLVSIREVFEDGDESSIPITDTLAIGEYKYDEAGVLRYAKLHNRIMSYTKEKYLNSSGETEKTIFTQQGEIESAIETTLYTYLDGVLACKVHLHGEPECPLEDSIVYDESGAVVREIGYCKGLIYKEVEYFYSEGKLQQKIAKISDENDCEIISENWSYDSCGSVSEWTSIREYSPASKIPQMKSHNKIEYEYDKVGNVICRKDSFGGEMRYVFSYFE